MLGHVEHTLQRLAQLGGSPLTFRLAVKSAAEVLDFGLALN